MYKITYEFEDKNLKPIILENVTPQQTLLEVSLKNDIEIHHNCGGVCACTTCHVYIEQGMDLLADISDKEENYIDRANSPKLNSRLSCQAMLINKNGGEIKVLVPDQSQFLGE